MLSLSLSNVRASRYVLFEIIVGLNTNCAPASVNVAIVKPCKCIDVAVTVPLMS